MIDTTNNSLSLHGLIGDKKRDIEYGLFEKEWELYPAAYTAFDFSSAVTNTHIARYQTVELGAIVECKSIQDNSLFKEIYRVSHSPAPFTKAIIGLKDNFAFMYMNDTNSSEVTLDFIDYNGKLLRRKILNIDRYSQITGMIQNKDQSRTVLTCYDSQTMNKIVHMYVFDKDYFSLYSYDMNIGNFQNGLPLVDKRSVLDGNILYAVSDSSHNTLIKFNVDEAQIIKSNGIGDNKKIIFVSLKDEWIYFLNSGGGLDLDFNRATIEYDFPAMYLLDGCPPQEGNEYRAISHPSKTTNDLFMINKDGLLMGVTTNNHQLIGNIHTEIKTMKHSSAQSYVTTTPDGTRVLAYTNSKLTSYKRR